MKHIVELTAKYKAGHQHFTAPTGVIGRNIVRVERVPEEVPDHQDGALTRLITSVGENIMVRGYWGHGRRGVAKAPEVLAGL